MLSQQVEYTEFLALRVVDHEYHAWGTSEEWNAGCAKHAPAPDHTVHLQSYIPGQELAKCLDQRRRTCVQAVAVAPSPLVQQGQRKNSVLLAIVLPIVCGRGKSQPISGISTEQFKLRSL
jgi:hypothetical protein